MYLNEANKLNYYTLNPLTLFWLAESLQWILEIGARDVITADYSRFSPVMWSKLKTVIIQWIKSRTWDTTDDWYINNLSKNQVFAVFHSHVICRSVSPKFIELSMETPCLCPSERHKHGGRSAWFLRVIMSSSRALCCFPSVKKQKRDFHSFRSKHNNYSIRFLWSNNCLQTNCECRRKFQRAKQYCSVLKPCIQNSRQSKERNATESSI